MKEKEEEEKRKINRQKGEVGGKEKGELLQIGNYKEEEQKEKKLKRRKNRRRRERKMRGEKEGED